VSGNDEHLYALSDLLNDIKIEKKHIKSAVSYVLLLCSSFSFNLLSMAIRMSDIIAEYKETSKEFDSSKKKIKTQFSYKSIPTGDEERYKILFKYCRIEENNLSFWKDEDDTGKMCYIPTSVTLTASIFKKQPPPEMKRRRFSNETSKSWKLDCPEKSLLCIKTDLSTGVDSKPTFSLSKDYLYIIHDLLLGDEEKEILPMSAFLFFILCGACAREIKWLISDTKIIFSHKINWKDLQEE